VLPPIFGFSYWTPTLNHHKGKSLIIKIHGAMSEQVEKGYLVCGQRRKWRDRVVDKEEDECYPPE